MKTLVSSSVHRRQGKKSRRIPRVTDSKFIQKLRERKAILITELDNKPGADDVLWILRLE
jgi:hypothetical protein